MLDSEELLVRVPFARLDLEALAPEAGYCLPGCISQETQHEPHWWFVGQEEASGLFPREIALRVLSSAHYRVRVLRIVFHPAKRPSQLNVLVAPPRTAPSSMDPLSQYLSAAFEPMREPIVWPPESALRWPLPPTELVVPIPRQEAWDHDSPVAFIKLLMHRPHFHPDNTNQEIGFSQLELLGSFHLPSRAIRLSAVEFPLDSQSPETGVEPCKDPMDCVQQSLQAAGMPESLIQDLLETSARMAPESSTSGSSNPIITQSNDTSIASDQYRPEDILESPFDRAMRDFVAHQARQDHLLASIETSRPTSGDSDTRKTLTCSLSMARINSCDPTRFEAIATHTFGSFFTQCLMNSDSRGSPICVEGLQLAERLTPLLRTAGLPIELVYEGLIAVAVLALNSDASVDVFHAVLHLIRTVFLERTTSGLSLLQEMPKGQVNVGLAVVLTAVLACPFCWSLSSKTTVDRELLKTLRLLITQTSTRSSFLRAIWSRDHGGNQASDDDGSTPQHLRSSLHRLRVARWLLQRHAEKLTAQDRVAIRAFLGPFGGTAPSCDSKQNDLAAQCLCLLDTATSAEPSDLETQLHSLRLHLQEHDRPANNDDHVPLFVAFPLTTAQHDAIVSQLRQYFQLHQRPAALYHHAFTTSSLEGHSDGDEFRKGNIVFRGHAQARTEVPSLSVHDAIKQHAKPFEFAPAHPSITVETPVIAIETLFARFRGTLEPRRQEGSTSEATRRVIQSQVSASRPTQTTMRQSSNAKLGRVVPVTAPPVVEAESPPAATPSIILTEQPLPAERTAPIVVPQNRRASTAAPGAGATKSQETGVSIGRTHDATLQSSPSPTQTATPKTAPAGKTRKSSEAGCAVQ